ncbi:CRISPR-associated endoribonuclease Cas6 [Clostridium sp. ZBS2]|uniref:CRISPR-associated endoribonuclease Cas6 n=1 Tax=Clostridium sp. ZBS2 TaxID=2949976 RepID=UPI00207A5F17|nr:CRISPR-associated endoribonuclease Cas6 [Clostridium sp. ZBS2]
MRYTELTLTTLLKTNIKFTQSSEIIGKNISYAMLRDSKLKEYHEEKLYKYVFDNFFPIEKDGIYKENRIYIFNIRGFDENIISKLKCCLDNYESNDLKIISIEIKEIDKKQITFLKTVTPAIITVDSKPWLYSMDILNLVKRLHANAEKKYRFFFGEEIGKTEDYFIEKLKILNNKPIPYRYKGKTLLGNKFKIKVNEDQKSQKLAFTILGAGLAEKNSILGAGYSITDRR